MYFLISQQMNKILNAPWRFDITLGVYILFCTVLVSKIVFSCFPDDSTCSFSKLKYKEKRKRTDPVSRRIPLHPQKTAKGKGTIHNRHTKKNFDYTTIADRLRTVSWSNDSRPTCVVKPVYAISTFPFTTKDV